MHIEQSEQRRAFAFWLRTGRRLIVAPAETVERKFNPYHDPRDGRFTFGPGGGAGNASASGGLTRARPDRSEASFPRSARTSPASSEPPRPDTLLNDGVFRPDGTNLLQLVQGERSPPRMGDNIRAFNDPMTLEQVFPGLRDSPGGSIIAAADGIFNFSGPASGLTTTLSQRRVQVLVEQIQAIDPDFRLQSLGEPVTFEGQMRQIRDLQIQRAMTIYRKLGNIGPLQVETVRFLQERVDIAYDQGLEDLKTGRLKPEPTRDVALGNFVDRQVRFEVRQFYRDHAIRTDRDSPIRINARAYDTGGITVTYTVPDHRAGDVGIDWTLSPKTAATKQVGGFFRSDFQPSTVIIIRPSQRTGTSVYAITRPRKVR